MKKRSSGNDKLLAKGWKFDGLWLTSPYTGLRYMKREAMAIEELRKWSACNSAILGDKEHSMWVIKEQQDNALIDMDELSKRCQERRLISERSSESNLKGKGTD